MDKKIKLFAIVLFIIAIAMIASSFTSDEIDELCNDSSTYLYRNITDWTCRNISGPYDNITLNQFIRINVQNLSGFSCTSYNNGSIGRNSTDNKIWYCDGNMWNELY